MEMPPLKKRQTPKESVIESKVCAHAKDRGFLVYKFTSPNRRSVPDRMFITPGRGYVFFIEFKSKGNKPTKAQFDEIRLLKEHHQLVYVVDTIDEGKRIIDRLALEDAPVQGS
jgi:hypothetical protein